MLLPWIATYIGEQLCIETELFTCTWIYNRHNLPKLNNYYQYLLHYTLSFNFFTLVLTCKLFSCYPQFLLVELRILC